MEGGGEGGEQTKMEVERLLTGSGVRGGGVQFLGPWGPTEEIRGVSSPGGGVVFIHDSLLLLTEYCS